MTINKASSFAGNNIPRKRKDILDCMVLIGLIGYFTLVNSLELSIFSPTP